jgi:hypothetical protein
MSTTAFVYRLNRSSDSSHSQTDEGRTRRQADALGYSVKKSRRRTLVTLDDRGKYMLISARTGAAVLGGRYDATLEEIEKWLQREFRDGADDDHDRPRRRF